MKTGKKALLLALCAVLLVAASVLGTMAYLTSSDSVKNTFTVGNVAITLDEAKVGTDGKALSGDQAVRVDENSYKLMPGHVYDKDPIIHVDNTSEDCYLFIKVEDGISEIEDAKTVATQLSENGWVAVAGHAGVYVYGTEATPTVVTKGTDVNTFKTITVKGDITNTQLASYATKEIVVTAYAVQVDGFSGKTATQILTTAFPTL